MNQGTEGSPQCKHCGHVPRDKPVSGRWYCPRCGKTNVIARPKTFTLPNPVRKPSTRRPSKDKVYNQLYEKLASQSSQDTVKTDLGYKEPYIYPPIPEIQPKKREKIKVFTPTQKME